MQLTLDVSHCCLNKYVDPVEYSRITWILNKITIKYINNIKHTNAKRTSQNIDFHNNKANSQIVGHKYVFLAKVHNYLKKKIIVLEFIPVKPDIWNKIFFFLIEQFIETLEIYSWKSSLFF